MYAIFLKGYQSEVNQVDTGRVDYLIGTKGLYSDVIIEQGSGWDVNWEMINFTWEIINDTWE